MHTRRNGLGCETKRCREPSRPTVDRFALRLSIVGTFLFGLSACNEVERLETAHASDSKSTVQNLSALSCKELVQKEMNVEVLLEDAKKDKVSTDRISAVILPLWLAYPVTFPYPPIDYRYGEQVEYLSSTLEKIRVQVDLKNCI